MSTIRFSPLVALTQRASTAPDSPLATFVEGQGAFTLSNIQAKQRVAELRNWLVRSGFGPGDACAVFTGNTPAFLIALLAITDVGGVCVPVIEQSTASELEFVVHHSGVRLLIARDELIHSLSEHSSAHSVPSVDLERFAATGAHLPECPTLSARASGPCADDTRILMYTSGSSGNPKGVELSAAAIDFTINSYVEHLQLTANDRVLICMPLFHINGMMLQLLPALVSGAQLVITPRFSVSAYWSWVDTYEITVAHLVNGPIRLLLQSPVSPNRSLRLMTFGLPLESAEILEFEKRFNTQLLMVWGLTETCCGATLSRLGDDRQPEYQNVGPALPGWEIFTREQGLDGVGELMVRSPGIMTCYHADPKATRDTLVEGAVATGDLGYIDADGDVHFVSRKKDMLKPSGENVSAAEVSETLLAHEAVCEAAVFGVPDPIRVERVIAVIVLNADLGHARSDSGTQLTLQLREHCALTLARFKIPSEILFVEEIPKTSIGKQRMGALRDMYQEGSLTAAMRPGEES